MGLNKDRTKKSFGFATTIASSRLGPEKSLSYQIVMEVRKYLVDKTGHFGTMCYKLKCVFKLAELE